MRLWKYYLDSLYLMIQTILISMAENTDYLDEWVWIQTILISILIGMAVDTGYLDKHG